MEQDSLNNHKISPIHRKALDIFTLSSQISRYILPDLAKLQSNGFEVQIFISQVISFNNQTR